MESKLLNYWAIGPNGKIISIEHAQKGESYTCPQCHEPLIFRKKGDGPRAHQDHFAHKPGNVCSFYTSHDPESEIHKLAKEAIYKILRNYIEEQRELPISWTCPDCGSTFNGNLLKRAKTVEKEKKYKDRTDSSLFKQPDVSLIDENGKLIVAIEVIFTHDVDDDKLQFFAHNNVVLVKIYVQSAEDCNDMEQMLKAPDSVNLCFNKDCHLCQSLPVCRTICRIWNKDKTAYIALVAGVYNIFGEESVAYLPFLPQDEQLAMAYAKEYWPDKDCALQQGKEFQYVAPVRQQKVVSSANKFYHRLQRGPLIEYYMSRMENGGYSTNYPKPNKNSNRPRKKR